MAECIVIAESETTNQIEIVSVKQLNSDPNYYS
jgi:hypothetical protein